ncbi:cupin domain-containing protein [Novosphingobium bradum]|uniref:Cupin domain-containing protein n=1 Tax=Novosphingobium bradum TaxID=1737444 RepID=A0ABV7IPH5_9SPHN
MSEDTAAPAATHPGITIHRAADAPSLVESGCIHVENPDGPEGAGLRRLMEAGYGDADEIRVLANLPGFSLMHAWFKPNAPLPLHSHDADCLYFIVSGSLRLGTEDLGPRDTFFVPCDVPYTYKVGPEGVEVLEFRHAGHVNFVNLVKGTAWWDKAVQQVLDNREAWPTARRPALNV